MNAADQQAAIAEWFKSEYPAHSRKITLVTDNVERGVMISVKRGGFSRLWIELKDKGTYSSLSRRRRDELESRKEQGYRVWWCPGVETAKKAIKDYMELDK